MKRDAIIGPCVVKLSRHSGISYHVPTFWHVLICIDVLACPASTNVLACLDMNQCSCIA